MKSEIIENELRKIVNGTGKVFQNPVSDEMAFNYLTLWYFYLCNELRYKVNKKKIDEIDYRDLETYITDGSNDGGIDYIYLDDESTAKVVVVQSKYTESLDYNTIIAELKKMSNTIDDFSKVNTSHYNTNVKRELQNALDSLPDSQSTNVEYVLFTTAEISNVDEILSRIDNDQNPNLNRDSVSIYQVSDIESKISQVNEEILTVDYDSIRIDKPKNILEYENKNVKGIMVNISSKSVTALYNKYHDNGLFDLNIRRYIKNKMVDAGINKSLKESREDFWFLNNGIIIACKDFEPDGNTIKLYDFSIVNGGQTTNLIGEDKSKNLTEFFLPCKIISQKNAQGADMNFYTKIAEATNSQKPIYARDLKSNSPEMRRLQTWLGNEKIYLEIKRGVKIPKKQYEYHIKNDELAQLILSVIYQKPGTARSNKKEIFENTKLYGQIFKIPYEKDNDKKDCLIDIIKLNDKFDALSKALLTSSTLTMEEKIILKNGKQVIFAIMGLLFLWANNDISLSDTLNNAAVLTDFSFGYSKIIGNYKKDDLDEHIKQLLIVIIELLTEQYTNAYENKRTTSVSNYFKKDSTYIDEIVPFISKKFDRYHKGTLNEHSVIFFRDSD